MNAVNWHSGYFLLHARNGLYRLHSSSECSRTSEGQCQQSPSLGTHLEWYCEQTKSWIPGSRPAESPLHHWLAQGIYLTICGAGSQLSACWRSLMRAARLFYSYLIPSTWRGL